MFGSSSLSLTHAVVSGIGKRAVNEDSVSVFSGSNGYGFILCDGLGGHGMGDKASSLVCEAFHTNFANMNKLSEVLPVSFESAQSLLLAEQKRLSAEKKMKTTAVALATDGKKAYVGHIGDSRLYFFRKGKIVFRTLDHSVPQMLVLSKEIKDSDIRNHPDRSSLLRVMGIEWGQNSYEIMKPISLKKGDSFLLCSDGFWELIEENDMCELLNHSSSVEEWLQKMNSLVQEHGKTVDMDNNTAIAVWCR